MSADPSAVAVRLLGPVRLLVGGRAVDLTARMPRNLLALLALAPGRVQRVDTIVDALWGDDAPASAVGTLQSYVSILRRLMGDREREHPLLARRHDGYVLDIAPEAVDAVRFERAVVEAAGQLPAAAIATLDSALAEWNGPALGDVADEGFAAGAAVRLDEMRLQALEARMSALLDLGQHQSLVPDLEALVAEHPLRETLTVLLMTALYRSGRQAEALRAYERTRRTLADELGIDPSPPLAAAERAVLDQSLSAAPVAAGARRAPVADDAGAIPRAAAAALRGPLLGRELEQVRLAEAWVNRAERRVLAISGDAGIGKTRLAAELAREVHDGGAIVLWGTCTPDAGGPLASLVAALRPIVSADRVAGDRVLGRLYPELLDAGSDASEDREPQMAAAVASVLRSCGPTLLVLDDVHWIDQSTAALIHSVAADPDLDELLITLTYRPGDVQRATPIGTLLADLRRRRRLDHLPVSGLSDAAAMSLVEVLAGERTSQLAALADRLARRSEGNPFFIEELVTHALQHDGVTVDVPAAVVDVVEQRIGELDDVDRRTLLAAAVLGRTFDVGDVAAMTGRGVGDLVDLLELGIDRRLLLEAGPPVGRFEFVHALTREAILSGASELRIAQLHVAAADALTGHDGPDRVVEIAHHLLAAGGAADRDRATAAALAAARRSLELFAYDAAGAFVSAALPLGGAATVDLWQVLGEIHLAQGRTIEAREAFRHVVAAAWRERDGVRAAVAACTFSAALGVGVGLEVGVPDVERIEWLETALDLLGARPGGLRSRARAHLAIATYDLDAERCARASLEALAETVASGDPTVRTAGWVARRVALWRPSAPLDERLHAGAEAVRESDACPASYRLVSRFGHMGDLLEAGEIERCRHLLTEAAELAEPLHQPRWDWFGRIGRAGLLLAEGRFDEAEPLVERAHEAVGDAIGATPHVTHAVQRFLVERDTGRAASSEARLAEILAAVPDAPLIRALYALSLADVGEGDAASEHLDIVSEDAFAGVPDDYLRLPTLAWCAEAAWRTGNAAAAGALVAALDGFDGRLAAVGVAAIAGPVSRARALALAAVGQDAAAIELLDTAHAELAAAGFEALRARAAAELAALRQA